MRSSAVLTMRWLILAATAVAVVTVAEDRPINIKLSHIKYGLFHAHQSKILGTHVGKAYEGKTITTQTDQIPVRRGARCSVCV
jgi:hypothetical protein